MNIKKILTLFLKEMNEVFRDKKSLTMMIFIPLILYPFVLISTGYFSGNEINKVKNLKQSISIFCPDPMQQVPLIEELKKTLVVIKSTNPRLMLNKGEVEAVVEVNSCRLTGTSEFVIYFDKTRLGSVTAEKKIKVILEKGKKRNIVERLRAYNITEKILENFKIESINIASSDQMGAFIVSKIFPLMILILLFSGAMHNAISITAGEKQRQTLETILVSPLTRTEIVIAKYLTIFCTSLISTIIGLISLYLVFSYGFYMISNLTTESFSLSAVGLLLMFISIIPLSILFSSVLFMVGCWARTYKEAELYNTGILIIIIAIGIMTTNTQENIDINYFLFPVFNVVLTLKELLKEQVNVLHISLTVFTTFIYSFISLIISQRLFSKEAIILRI
ncbi:MAG: ABC transporter permease subunit [Bacteroidetes bacterium]|nr:ABC transporter permease subunit [Bacteroidota bacterium]